MFTRTLGCSSVQSSLSQRNEKVKKALNNISFKKNVQLYRWANTKYKLILKLWDIFLWLTSSTQDLYSAVVSSPIHTIFTFTYFSIKINYHIQHENTDLCPHQICSQSQWFIIYCHFQATLVLIWNHSNLTKCTVHHLFISAIT